MKKILIISQPQFGYHSGIYNYSKYLSSDFKVSVLCHDGGKLKKDINTVNVVYVKYTRFILSQIKFILKARKLHRINKYDLVIIHYFISSSILNLCFKTTPLCVYINTSFIFKNKRKESFFNNILRLEYKTFKYRTVLSSSLGKYLGLANFIEMPLGGEKSNFVSYHDNLNPRFFNIIYIGTLYDRNIEKTIQGIALLKSKYEVANFHYDIIGFGSIDEVNTIKNEINRLQLNNCIKYHGEIRRPQLNKFLEKANIGVSFIPCRIEYDCQPPTKTFEYLMYGIPVIATATSEHKKIINQTNGILVNDNPEDFSLGLEKLLKIYKTFDRNIIFNNSDCYSWENIVKSKLLPYINKILNS